MTTHNWTAICVVGSHPTPTLHAGLVPPCFDLLQPHHAGLTMTKGWFWVALSGWWWQKFGTETHAFFEVLLGLSATPCCFPLPMPAKLRWQSSCQPSVWTRLWHVQTKKHQRAAVPGHNFQENFGLAMSAGQQWCHRKSWSLTHVVHLTSIEWRFKLNQGSACTLLFFTQVAQTHVGILAAIVVWKWVGAQPRSSSGVVWTDLMPSHCGLVPVAKFVVSKSTRCTELHCSPHFMRSGLPSAPQHCLALLSRSPNANGTQPTFVRSMFPEALGKRQYIKLAWSAGMLQWIHLLLSLDGTAVASGDIPVHQLQRTHMLWNTQPACIDRNELWFCSWFSCWWLQCSMWEPPCIHAWPHWKSGLSMIDVTILTRPADNEPTQIHNQLDSENGSASHPKT